MFERIKCLGFWAIAPPLLCHHRIDKIYWFNCKTLCREVQAPNRYVFSNGLELDSPY